MKPEDLTARYRGYLERLLEIRDRAKDAERKEECQRAFHRLTGEIERALYDLDGARDPLDVIFWDDLFPPEGGPVPSDDEFLRRRAMYESKQRERTFQRSMRQYSADTPAAEPRQPQPREMRGE